MFYEGFILVKFVSYSIWVSGHFADTNCQF